MNTRQVKKYNELPEDAVILSKGEALRHQYDLLKQWDTPKETWPLRYGVMVLGGAAAVGAMYINGHFRRKLRLGKIGYVTTYLPITALPAMMASLFHKMVISNNVLLDKTECPVCLQVKAAGIQVFFGLMYPLVLGPLGNFMYATRHATYKLPDITTDPMGSVRVLQKFARPIGTQLSVILVGQALLASYVTYQEAKSYYTIQQKIQIIEQEYDINRSNWQ